MKVRERLEELMRSLGWSQARLAAELGEHRNWVNKRITGLTEIKADELPRLAEVLNVSPCLFFFESQEDLVKHVVAMEMRVPQDVVERFGYRIEVEAPEPLVATAGAEHTAELVKEALQPLVEKAAEQAAERATEKLRAELKAMLGEIGAQVPATERTIAERKPGYKPSLAEIWARGRVRQWEQLSETKQRRILEIMEEPEESKERQDG